METTTIWLGANSIKFSGSGGKLGEGKLVMGRNQRTPGGNTSLPNKIPLVLPFEGFPPVTKQVTNSFFYIKLHTLSFRGVITVITQSVLND